MVDIEKNIICILCNHYLVDAVTLTNCLHFFCRTCLLKHVQKINRCPKCFQNLGNDLEAAFRRDRCLQNLVYKLVPDLFWRQLKQRRKRDATRKSKGIKPSERHAAVTHEMIGFGARVCALKENISLSIEYASLAQVIQSQTNAEKLYDTVCKPSTSRECNDNNEFNLAPVLFKRYFRCPAQIRIKDLRKLLELKLTMTENYLIYFLDSTLGTVFEDEMSLQDLIYIYAWDRCAPFRIYFTMARASLIDEDKPPVLDVEEALPQLSVEFCAPSIIKNQFKKEDDNDSKALAPQIDAEPLPPSLPRLSVQLSTSAFNNAARGGAHQPIITTFPAESNNSANASSSIKSAQQPRKRKKNMTTPVEEGSAKLKKISKKAANIPVNITPTALFASTQANDNNALSPMLFNSKLTTENLPSSSLTLNNSTIDISHVPSQQTATNGDVLPIDNSILVPSSQPKLTSTPCLKTPKLPKKLKPNEQSLKHLHQLNNNCYSNGTTTSQNASTLNVSSNSSVPINANNFFSTLCSTANAAITKNFASKQSVSPTSFPFPLSKNGSDLASILPQQQQQEMAARAYFQLMKMSQTDSMSLSLFGATPNSATSPLSLPPPFGNANIYQAMAAAAASNQFFAALCKNVSPPLSLASNSKTGSGNAIIKKKSTDFNMQQQRQKQPQQEFRQQNNLLLPIKKLPLNKPPQQQNLPKEIVKSLNNGSSLDSLLGKKIESQNALNFKKTPEKSSVNNRLTPSPSKTLNTTTTVHQQNAKTTSICTFNFENKSAIRLSSVGAAPLLTTASSN